METINIQTDWANKYRPKTFDELILPKRLEARLRAVSDAGQGMSLMLYGQPGCGKTTTGMLLNPENLYMINCTVENSIHTIRRLGQTCSSLTLNGTKRLVLLDEADYLSDDAQAALRGLVESHAMANDFVMTVNKPNRLSEAIRSRFLPIHFDFIKSNEMIGCFTNRLKEIAVNEGHDNLDISVISGIVKTSFPDFRNMIKRLQFELLA